MHQLKAEVEKVSYTYTQANGNMNNDWKSDLIFALIQ
jgi:hypothetical protein